MVQPPITHKELQRLGLFFLTSDVADLRDPEDQRIHEWLNEQLTAAYTAERKARPFPSALSDRDAFSTTSQPRGSTSTDAEHAETKNGFEGIFDRWHVEPLIREWLNGAGTKPNVIDGLVNTMRLRLSRADADRAEPSTACWVQTRPWQDGDSRGFATYEAAARYADPLGKPVRPLYSGDTGEVVIGWWAHTIGYEHGDNRPFRKPSKAIAFAAENGGIIRPFSDGGFYTHADLLEAVKQAADLVDEGGRDYDVYSAYDKLEEIKSILSTALMSNLRFSQTKLDPSDAMISAMLAEVEKGRGSGSMANMMRRVWVAGARLAALHPNVASGDGGPTPGGSTS